MLGPLGVGEAENESVWAATCFFVRAGARRQGVSGVLLKAGLAFARESGARVVEASRWMWKVVAIQSRFM